MEDTENQDLSWLPVLKLNLAMTNSKCLMLRRPGMQEELRIRGTKTGNPLRLGVFARKRGFS